MTHLAYIVPAYGLAVLVIVGFALDAMVRLRRARARLAAIDRRERA